MKRGTRVGQAYVAITADGSGINKDIVDDIDGAGGDIGKSGDKAGENYGDSFGDGLRETLEPIMEKMGDTLSKRLSRSVQDGLNKTANNTTGKGLGARLGDRIGEELAGRLELQLAAFMDTLDSKMGVSGNSGSSGGGGGGSSIGSSSTSGTAGGEQTLYRSYDFMTLLESARIKLHKESNDAIEKDDQTLLKTQQGIFDSLLKSEAERATFVGKFAAARTKLHEQSNDAIEKDDQSLLKTQQGIFDSILKDEKARTDLVGKFTSERTKLQEQSNTLIEKSDAALTKSREKNDRDLLKTQQGIFDSILQGEKAKVAFVGMFENARTKLHTQSNTLIEKADAALARSREKDYAGLVKSQQAQFDGLVKSERLGREANAAVVAKLEANRVKLRQQSNDAIEKLDLGLAKRQQKASETLLKVQQRALFNSLKAEDKARRGVSGNRSGSGFDVGKMFGKGSRNDGLNLIGASIGGLYGLFSKAASGVGSFVKVFQEGMDKAGASANIFQKLMGGAGATGGKAMSSLAASGPAAAVAIAIVIAAASVLISVLSALLAIVVALVATIASALVAAAAVGAGALLAIVAAGGLVTAAFMSMTNAQKDVLKTSFAPLRSEMVGIGQILLKDMVPAFQTWSQNLQQALLLLHPVAHAMGSAFAQAGTSLTAAFSGPGFQAMSLALSTYLPSIVRNLSLAFGRFMNGTMGLFTAIMPMVNRFAGYLAQVGARFSKWANSAKGQNAIADFVERAVGSLKSLWNATREVFGFISDLLFSEQAQNAGNSMFDSMASAFADMRKAIAKAIANGDLKKWFENAVEFGSALWGVVKALFKVFKALDSSHVLDAVTWSMKAFVGGIESAAWAGEKLIEALDYISRAFDRGVDSVAAYNAELGLTAQLSSQDSMAQLLGMPIGMTEGQVVNQSQPGFQLPPRDNDLNWLIGLGQDAQAATYESDGGSIPDPKKGYQNPYTAWAQQFIDSGPTIAQQIKTAIKEVNKAFRQALSQAAKAVGAGEAKSLISASIQSAKDIGDSMVESAQGALSSAASDLASASSAGDAARALKEVHRMQDGLKNAIKAQDRIEKAMGRLGKQKNVTGSFVKRLLEGDAVKRATLADYAAARERLAVKIEKANQKLVDAIAMRKDYKIAVIDAVKSFGSVLSAQASTIDGVEQALTYTDITKNLQDRLAKIRAFSEGLKKLLAMGLSNDVYQQLVDGGVEASGAFVEALVAGGPGAVGEVNGLTADINSVAQRLGTEASNRLYQAGVDAARGLVDGLNSMASQLDSAATRLGNAIASAIKKALGIHSPSTVMIAQMGYVGDGLVQGLDKQHGKVGSAAARLSSQVAVSPEVAAYAARQGGAATVSGNGGDTRFRDLIVHTPTENPKAVAREVLDEVTGRL